jgi:hypothetical protein
MAVTIETKRKPGCIEIATGAAADEVKPSCKFQARAQVSKTNLSIVRGFNRIMQIQYRVIAASKSNDPQR